MKHALLMIVLQLASSGADAFYTDRVMQSYHPHEHNPIAEPFVGSRSGRVAYFSVTAGMKIALPIELRRHGHEKLATSSELFGIADNAAGAVWSANGIHPYQAKH